MARSKKRRRLLLSGTILVVLLLCVLAVFCIPNVKIMVKDRINRVFPTVCQYQKYYQNNQLTYRYQDLNFETDDIKEIQVGNDRQYVINHARGYALAFPRDFSFDFRFDNEYFTGWNDEIKVVVSKEFAPYERDQVKPFVDNYLHKYLLAPKYVAQNKLTVHKDAVEKIGDYWVQVTAVSRTPVPGSEIKQNTYVYCYIYTPTRFYYRLMFKAPAYTDELIETVYKSLYSFSEDVPLRGVSLPFTDFKPEANKHWSKETLEMYERIANGDSVLWGIYSPLAVRNDNYDEIHELEKKVDYRFSGVLEYIYFGEDLPVEGMQVAHEDGKIVELTIQTATVMNENLDGYNPIFDIIDGYCDATIRRLASQAKEFGHPFLLRLNNEMNSDWTSYGASASMNDPELYVTLWRRIFDIFEEEGVNNAIWVFNPNNLTFPPCAYNSPMAYYPGNGYVHLFGVTGYNTGNYYQNTTGEKWREFSDIYNEIDVLYHDAFGSFPWIITEFASSSIGGDKVTWINNMFEDIPNHPNIKMAFWFSSADYDDAYPKETVVSRPYWMDENQAVINAFRSNFDKLEAAD